MKSISLQSGVSTLLKYAAAALCGAFLTSVVVVVVFLDARPDLSVWHAAELDEEFTAESPIESFSQYLALEERLFKQLDKLVYDRVPRGPDQAVNRYSRGSLSDPDRWPVNWNRSFELRQPDPAPGVLLLHGLSDSPYSLRALGEQLHERGATVVGLRIPGHGTAPSGLVDIRWQDMAAAVRLAARHLHALIGDQPLYLVGYSHGGALAVDYAISALNEPTNPPPSRIVLLSPEIGIAASAGLAIWQARLGSLLGLDKLAWNALKPEYDPFKYGSFAINAGDLAFRITKHLEGALASRERTGKLEDMPPILAFQSAVDATVTADALINNLFRRLPTDDHQLVLFDINRRVEISELLKQDPRSIFRPLMDNPDRRYDLTVVGNDGNSSRVVARTAVGGSTSIVQEDSLGEWPAGVYSLSHVALPFPPEDAVYGGPDATDSPGIRLGNLDLRGERGVLKVSGTDILRLRWNPFYDYQLSRILDFLDLADP